MQLKVFKFRFDVAPTLAWKSLCRKHYMAFMLTRTKFFVLMSLSVHIKSASYGHLYLLEYPVHPQDEEKCRRNKPYLVES